MPLKIPGSISFAKSIYPTDAVFSQGVFSDPSVERPVTIEQRKNLGVMASMKLEKESKPVEDVMKLNPTLNDRTFLDPDLDTLIVRFAVDFIGRTARPNSCNDARFIAIVRDLHEAYGAMGGYRELAERYLRNLAAGAWLWRNRDFSTKAEVSFESAEGVFEKVTINCLDIPTYLDDPLPAPVAAAMDELISQVAQSLQNGRLMQIEVTGRARMGKGREVYPSQVFPVKESAGADDKRGATDVTRILFHKEIAGKKTACMHAEKIGAALRAIDTWHNGYADPETGAVLLEPKDAVIINPYGQSRELHAALRYGKGAPSLRALMRGLDTLVPGLIANPEDETLRKNAHFVMANFIRGGVMGEKDA